MILGFGIDVVNIERFEKSLARYGARLTHRFFTTHERTQVESRTHHQGAAYAKRFAAKEAYVKALGTGFRGGIRFHDIEVRSTELGAPYLVLSGVAAQKLAALTPGGQIKVDLALSDDYPIAQAAVIISRQISVHPRCEDTP